MVCEKCEKCGNIHDGSFGSGRFCSLKCANSRGPRTQETKDKISNTVKSSIKNKEPQIPWNKGKFIVERVNKCCPECGKYFETTITNNKKYCSNECFLVNAGGYREGSGRGESGWYKGYYCDSSWELAFVIFNLDHNIYFERNTEKFKYEFEDKINYYMPDFILEDGSYLEIKGYKSKQWLAKLEQFDRNISVLYKNDMKKYFDYIYAKYGKNYIEMYENYKPKYSYVCSGCGKNFTRKTKSKYDRVFCSRYCSGKYGGRCQ